MDDKSLSQLNEHYEQMLEAFLKEIQRECERQAVEFGYSDLTPEGSIIPTEVWEDYLHEVNSFYYRSFHQGFFPAYRDTVKAETAEIYQVSRQVDTLREEIANNLIRYAQLYNRLKHLIQVLRGLVGEVEERQVELEQSREGVYHFLYQSLVELQEAVGELQGWYSSLEKLWAEPHCLELVARYVELQLLLRDREVDESPDLDTGHRDAVGRWLAVMANSAEALQVLAQEADAMLPEEVGKSWQAIANDLFRVPVGVPGFVEDFIHYGLVPRLQAEVALVGLRLKLRMLDSDQALVEDDEEGILEVRDYVASIQPVLERILALRRDLRCRELMAQPGYVEPADMEKIQSMSRLLREFECELGNGAEKLRQGRDLNPRELEQVAEAAVFRFEKELTRRMGRAEFKVPMRLQLENEGFRGRLSLFAVKFWYYREQLEHSLQEIDRYRHLTDLLRRHGEIFDVLQDDLELLLSPRSLRRAWGDLTVEVNRYPLIRGEQLPSECVHLLEEGRIERRLVPEKEYLTVLEEKGDLFRVEVDGLVRWEIPHLVVGMKE